MPEQKVTSDILFLQKARPYHGFGAGLAAFGYGLKRHPHEHLFCAAPGDGFRRHGDGIHAVWPGQRLQSPRGGRPVRAALPKPSSFLQAEIKPYELEELDEEEDRSIPADPNVRNFSYTVVDGQVYYRGKQPYAPFGGIRDGGKTESGA